LKTFAKSNEFLVIKGGLVEGETLDQEAFSKLADLEPREVLLAMFAGALKAPLTKLAGLMSAVLRQPASAMQQLLEKKEAAGPAVEPAEEEPAAEGAAEEAPAADE
nr:50S ribosomal protein L10 [Desulfuromonadales bacterium]